MRLPISSWTNLLSRLGYQAVPKKAKRQRRSRLENLEVRTMLAADAAGDEMASAYIVDFSSSNDVEIDANIGDGLYGDADVDLFMVSLAEGQTVTVDVDAYEDDNGNYISGLDSYLRVFDSFGSELASSYSDTAANDYGVDAYGYNSNYYDSYVSFTTASAGDFYFGISSYGNDYYDPTYEGSGYYGYSLGDYKLQLALQAPPTPTLSVGDITVNEGSGAASFEVTLNVPSGDPITVDYQTQDGSAVSGSDYSATNGSLTFAPSETSKTVTVAVIDDPDFEQHESFTLLLSNPLGAPVDADLGTATLTNDDSDAAGDQTSDAQLIVLDGVSPTQISAIIGDGLYPDRDVDLYEVYLSAEQALQLQVGPTTDELGNSLSDLSAYLQISTAVVTSWRQATTRAR